jgi:hypothetical protein
MDKERKLEVVMRMPAVMRKPIMTVLEAVGLELEELRGQVRETRAELETLREKRLKGRTKEE